MAIPMKPGELDELEATANRHGIRTALLLAHVSGQSAAYNDVMGIVAKPPSLISGLTETVAKIEKSGHISHPETDGLQHSRDMQTGCYSESGE
jgi:hypothetical protein